MNGHIYQRTVDGAPERSGTVTITDLDGNESLFDEDGVWLEGPMTQADPHLCK